MSVGSESMIERMARAIADARCDAGRPDPGKGLDEFIARAALQALMTPTPAMIEVGQKCEGIGGDGGQIYAAMIRSTMEGE